MITTMQKLSRRKQRVRAKISGTAECPRLSVRVSNRHLIAQLIDDTKGVTLASATTVKSGHTGTMTEKAVKAGQAIAAEAKKHKIKRVVFDRGGKLYHGRVQALADAARQEGLEF